MAPAASEVHFEYDTGVFQPVDYNFYEVFETKDEDGPGLDARTHAAINWAQHVELNSEVNYGNLGKCF